MVECGAAQLERVALLLGGVTVGHVRDEGGRVAKLQNSPRPHVKS